MVTKWVSYSSEPSEQGTVIVNSESTVVIDSFPPSPVNLVTIFGAARSGKSFLMNALARRDGMFGVSKAVRPCTRGVDLSKTLVSLDEFTGTSTDDQSRRTPCIGFVDVEGLGDRESSNCMKLVVPPMMLSKV